MFNAKVEWGVLYCLSRGSRSASVNCSQSAFCAMQQRNLPLRGCIAQKLICKSAPRWRLHKLHWLHWLPSALRISAVSSQVRGSRLKARPHLSPLLTDNKQEGEGVLWRWSYVYLRSYEDRHKKEAGIVMGNCNSLRQTELLSSLGWRDPEQSSWVREI